MQAQYHVIEKVVETKKRKRGGVYFRVQWQSDKSRTWIPRRNLDPATAAAYDEDGQLIKKSRTEVPIGPNHQAVIPPMVEYYDDEDKLRRIAIEEHTKALHTPILPGTKLTIKCPVHFITQEDADADMILCQGQGIPSDNMVQRDVLQKFNLKLRDLDVDYDKKHIVRKIYLLDNERVKMVTILCWLKNGTCVDLECIHPHSSWFDEEKNGEIPNWSEALNYPFILDNAFTYSEHKPISDSTLHTITSKFMMDLKKQFFPIKRGVYPPVASEEWDDTITRVWNKMYPLSQDIKNSNTYA
jgi:hypothetical protein